MTAEPATDIVESLAGAKIQHGSYNDRIYLMKLGPADPAEVAAATLAKASEEGYSKVFAKIPAAAAEPFTTGGFRIEAKVPRFYNGTHDALFLAAYLDAARKREDDADQLDQLLGLALKRKAEGVTETPALDPRFALQECTENNIERMAWIYSQVFPTYPFPIQEADYLRRTMRADVDYFAIKAGNQLVALASAEMAPLEGNVEMTDFATLTDWRGNGFGVVLLHGMEKAMRRKGLRTAYTIARSASPGMNITFAKMGYEFAGRLVNNTNIAGRIESMNIWYKPLA